MRAWSFALAGLLLLASFSGRAAGWRIAAIELPPSISERAPQQGYYAVLLRRVLREIGDDAEFVFLPPQRAYQEAAAGRLDAILPMRQTAERERDFWFTEPFFTAKLRLFLKADDAWEPASVAALRGEMGCTLLGSQSPPALQAEVNAGRIPLQTVSQMEACFRMLQAGRVRFVITGQNTGWAAARALHGEGLRLRAAHYVVAEEPVRLALSRKVASSRQRLRDFNQAVRRLRAQGVLQQLEAQHVPHRAFD